MRSSSDHDNSRSALTSSTGIPARHAATRRCASRLETIRSSEAFCAPWRSLKNHVSKSSRVCWSTAVVAFSHATERALTLSIRHGEQGLFVLAIIVDGHGVEAVHRGAIERSTCGVRVRRAIHRVDRTNHDAVGVLENSWLVQPVRNGDKAIRQNRVKRHEHIWIRCVQLIDQKHARFLQALDEGRRAIAESSRILTRHEPAGKLTLRSCPSCTRSNRTARAAVAPVAWRDRSLRFLPDRQA